MKSLTRMEELILLSIVNLQSNAYLIAITDHLAGLMDKDLSLNSIHLPLQRLEKAGLIESEMGEATAVRGGRRKKVYRLTKWGLCALEEHKKINDIMWVKFARLSHEKKS